MRWAWLLGMVCALAASAAAQDRPSGAGRAADRIGLAEISGQPMTIESDGLEALLDEQGRDRVIFQKNVRVRQGDMALHSDWLEAIYPQRESGGTSGGNPEKITARGNVRIERGDSLARCTRAVFEDHFCSAECVTEGGQAQLERRDDRIVADRIVFNLCTGVLRAEGNVRVRARPSESAE